MNAPTDQTIHEEEVQRRKHRHRLGWAMFGGIVLSLILVAVGLMWPQWRREAYLERLQQQGVGVSLVEGDVSLLTDISDRMGDFVGFGLPLPRQVSKLDFTRTPLDDETLVKFSGAPKLQQMLIAESPITPDALLEFVKLTDSLYFLTVLNCPRISPETAREIRLLKPGIQLEYRGTAYLGIQASDSPQGCMVFYVQPNSAAHRAGLSTGDIILDFDGIDVDSFGQLVELIAEHNPGDEVTLTIRDGNDVRQLQPILRGWTE